jgi:hypothetical protein
MILQEGRVEIGTDVGHGPLTIFCRLQAQASFTFSQDMIEPAWAVLIPTSLDRLTASLMAQSRKSVVNASVVPGTVDKK